MLVKKGFGISDEPVPESAFSLLIRRVDALESRAYDAPYHAKYDVPCDVPCDESPYIDAIAAHDATYHAAYHMSNDAVSDESPYIDHVVAYDETYDVSYDVSNYVDSVLANTDEYDVAYYARNTQSVPLNGHSADENQGSARNLNNDDHDEHILPEGADWTWEPIDYRIHAWGRFCIRGHNDQSDRALRNTSPKNKKCVVCNRMDSKAGKKNAALRAETKGAEFADTLEQDAALGETEGLAS